MKLRLVAFGALLVVGVGFGSAQAQLSPGVQVPTEHVASFNSDISLDGDNVVTFTETITYDFGTLSRRGIFRNVPKQYLDDQGNKYYLEFKLLGVDQDGQKAKTARQDNGTQAIVRIGDPDRTIRGRHIYVIRYSLTPVVRSTGSQDLLSLNITGNEWKVPIAGTSAKVTVPPGASVAGVQCFSGPLRSTAQNCHTAPQGSSVLVSSGPLAPGEGLSADVTMPPGSVEQYLVANKRIIHWGNFSGFIVAALLALLALLYEIWAWLKFRWQRKNQTIVPEYEAPDGLTVGEIGMLDDNRANMTEVTATLLDAAVNGYIRITQTKPKKLFSKPEYKLTRLKDVSKLPAPAGPLLQAVFGGNKEVTTKTIDRTKVSSAVTVYKTALRDSLSKKGYYAKPRRSRWGGLWLLAAVLLLAGNAVFALLDGAGWDLLLWNAVALVFGEVALGIALFRSRSTVVGAKEWAKVEGFQWFLRMTEKERLKFTDAPNKTPKLFSALLPFAVALGVEKEWAKQFEGIDVAAAAAGWYVGTAPFSSTDLSNNISGFAGTVSSSMSPVSSGGGGGGGGFSGGGFGGGGGGSW